MANVNVSFTDYTFTASVYTSNSPTITDGNWTVTVYSTSSNSVSITNTNTNVEIVNNGVMTIQQASTATIDEFVGNGIRTSFTLTEEVMGDEYVEVSIGGVTQNPGASDAYRVRTVNTGSETAVSYIDFSEAPPNGLDILAQYFSVRTAFDIQGPQGIPGPYTTVLVGSVSTASNTATVTMSGTTGTKYLNFVLPWVKGPKGDTGLEGPGASNLSWHTLPYKTGSNGPGNISIGYYSGYSDGVIAYPVPQGGGTSTYVESAVSIAIGSFTGYSNQKNDAVAIGNQAGVFSQNTSTVAVGSGAAERNQDQWAVAVGRLAGNYYQGQDAVAVGHRCGTETQGIYSVGIGAYAAERRQGDYAVAIGNLAGRLDQGQDAVAIGVNAGRTTQGEQSVAIGSWAGTATQAFASVAIGRFAGESNQGTRSVAIGNRAGEYNQGKYSLALGGGAGQSNMPDNTIVLNATGSDAGGGTAYLNPTVGNAFYVKPVRHVTNGSLPSGFYNMAYNPTTGEIIYWT